MVGTAFAGTFSSLNGGISAPVLTLHANDTLLYIGGQFTLVDGMLNVNRIAVYDGTNWDKLGTGMNNEVNCLAIYNYELYAGGHFTSAGGNSVTYVAKWDGTNWSAVGSTLDGPVLAMAVFKDELYIGGEFTYGLQKLSGGSWVHPNGYAVNNGDVNALYADNDGSLYVGYETIGTILSDSYLSRYDGSTFSAVTPKPDGPVRAITVANNALLVGGEFSNVGALSVDNFASLDLRSGVWYTTSGLGSTGYVNAILYPQSGSYAYVTGEFNTIPVPDYAALLSLAGTWYPLAGHSLNDHGYAVVEYDGGFVYGGKFTHVSPVSDSQFLVRWDW